jgi:hypothetical protein
MRFEITKVMGRVATIMLMTIVAATWPLCSRSTYSTLQSAPSHLTIKINLKLLEEAA